MTRREMLPVDDEDDKSRVLDYAGSVEPRRRRRTPWFFYVWRCIALSCTVPFVVTAVFADDLTTGTRLLGVFFFGGAATVCIVEIYTGPSRNDR